MKPIVTIPSSVSGLIMDGFALTVDRASSSDIYKARITFRGGVEFQGIGSSPADAIANLETVIETVLQER